MKQLITLLLLISSLAVSAQTTDGGKRIITGRVWDPVSNSCLAGQNILEYKTANGTVSRQDGTFELSVSREDTVLLHIPLCFDSFFILYLPHEDNKEIILTKKLSRRSRKTLVRWEKMVSDRVMKSERHQ